MIWIFIYNHIDILYLPPLRGPLFGYLYLFILIFYVYLLCGVFDLDVNPAIDLVLFGHGDTTHPLDIT